MDKKHLKLWLLQVLLTTAVVVWPGLEVILQFFWLVPLLILSIELTPSQARVGSGILLVFLGTVIWLSGQRDWFYWLAMSGYVGLAVFTGQLVRSRRWNWAQLAATLALVFFLWDLTVMLWNWKAWQQQLALIYRELGGQIDQLTQLTASLYGQTPTVALKEEMQKMLYWSVLLLPAQSLSVTLLSAWSTAFWAGRHIGQYDSTLLPLPLREWKLPWYLIWLVISGLLLLFYGPSTEGIRILAAGCIYLGAGLALVNGLSFISLLWPYMSSWGKYLLVFSFILSGVVMLPLLILVGLLDLGFGWRQKLLTKTGGNG